MNSTIVRRVGAAVADALDLADGRALTQPMVAIGATAFALALIVSTAIGDALVGIGFLSPADLIIAGSLIVGILLAYQFPIYIRHNTKICVISIPLFLIAALLPPALGGIAAMIGMLAGELSVRAKRGTRMVDISTMAGRWSAMVVVASMVAHAPVGSGTGIVRDLPFAAAGLFLWVADLLTLPLALAPVCRERPARIVVTAVREGGMAEAAQYVLGILGVLLATQQMWALAMLLVPAGLVYLAFKKEMDLDTFQLLENMADNVDMRGSYTNGHSQRVRELVEGILDQLGMHGQEAKQIITAARLHDIGKIGLPDQLLINPGTLSPEDQDALKSYPNRGAELMEAYPDFSRGIEMIRHHHERWDGTGYPLGLAGTDIPFGARVIAVADSFDAMTSERPYRRALTVEQAAQILLNGAGRQWDPRIVNAFLASIDHQVDQVAASCQAPAPETSIPSARSVPA